jgi:hypothetical protein
MVGLGERATEERPHKSGRGTLTAAAQALTSPQKS